MKKYYLAAAALFVLSALSLAACRKTDTRKPTPATNESLSQETTGVVDRASEKLSEAAETVSEKISEAAETIRDGLTDASERLSEMGTTGADPGN